MQNRIIALMFETTSDVNIGDKAFVDWNYEVGKYWLAKFNGQQLLHDDVNWDVLDGILAYVEKKIGKDLYVLDEHLCYDGLEDAELTVVYTNNTGLVIVTASPQVSEMILSQENIELYEEDDRISLTEVLETLLRNTSIGTEIPKEYCECSGQEFALPDLKNRIENKEEKSMFQDLIFGGKVNDGQFRMSINGLAVRGAEGKYYTFNPTTKELVEVTNGFFDQMNDLLFTMPALELEKGDIIIHQNKPYYITVSDNNVIKGASFIDATEDVLLPKTNLFGQSYFIKVFNCLGTNNILGSDITSNPTLAFALMGGKDMDLSKLLMFQAMGKGGEIADFSENPMMLMALMGNDNSGNMNDFMKMQMLASLSKTKKGNKKSEKAE